MDADDLPEARELHAKKRRWLVVVGGNLTVLIVMLGVPWLRGYLRTRALWQAFGVYGACLYDGETVPSPGLGMPVGHEAQFATRALREPSFYARCDEALSALAPGEVTFLAPAVKAAETDLRGAVALVKGELLPLSQRTPGTRLSRRPLAALERLRAALASHTRATGAVDVPERDAFALPKGGDVLPTPARLPLGESGLAQVALWSEADTLHAFALAATAVSSLSLRDGTIWTGRLTRPKLLEAALPSEAPRMLVWAMARGRCLERATGCSDKTAGIAPLVSPLSELPAPRWLGAHPSGRPDRTMVIDEARVWVLAERRDGAELREFTLDGGASRDDETPLAATRTGPTVPLGSSLLLVHAGTPRVLAASALDGAAVLSEQTVDGARPIGTHEGKGDPWLVGCTDPAGLALAFGDDTGLRLARLGADGTTTLSESIALALRDVVHINDVRRDRVLRVCGTPGQEVALVRDAGDQLALVRCRSGEPCRVERLGSGVYGIGARIFGTRLIVAYAGAGESSQVRVRAIALDQPVSDEEVVPAVCWSDGEGLCGLPQLTQRGAHVLLATRSGADLSLLESADGLTWSTLRGLQKRE